MFCGRLLRVALVCSLFSLTSIAIADDAGVIKQSADEFTTAFNKGDAKAVAALWTEKGVLVDETGRKFAGRPAIEAAYAELFKAHPGIKITVSPGTPRKLMGDSLLEEGSASISPVPEGAPGQSKYTAIHVKENGKYLMSNVREYPATTTPKESALLKDLGWLVGTWIAEEKGAKTEVVCRWLPNDSYLERHYKVTTPDGKTTEGIQLVGLNPRTGQVVSWGFGFDGGHTIGSWIPRGNGWGIDSAGITPDGTPTRAMNIMTRLDDNAYSWQSVDRTVAGVAQPSTDEIILKRSEAKK